MCDVLVIGGGWAGISAAMDAAKRGATVVVVEERPYLGGRARSFTDKTTGEEIDNGQHLMMGCYASTLSVLRELSTDGLIHRQDALRVRFIDADGRQDLLDAGLLPGAAGVAAGIVRLRHLSTRSRLKILDLAVRLRMGRVVSADLTCENFLLRYGQTSEAITRFWEPIILATLNAPIGQAAADLLVAVMRLAFLGGPEDSKLYLPTVGLSELIAPFPAWMARHGGSVLTSTSCDEIRIENSRVTEVVLSNGQTLRPRQVVAAVPERSLSKLGTGNRELGTGPLAPGTWHLAPGTGHLAPGTGHLAPGTGHAAFSPIISIYLWYDKAFMDETFVAALGTTTQWVFDRRRIQRSVSDDVVSAYPGHVALTMSAGSSLAQRPAEEIIEHCDKELRQLFRGRMEGVKRLHGLVIKEKMATPLITPRTERPVVSALHGMATNLWVAGDWTGTGLPATIEGASRSGVAAARAALPV